MKQSESTTQLLRALKGVERIDLSQLAGSGINIDLTNFTTDRSLTGGPVTIPAEDAGPLLQAMRESLINALQRRRQSLAMDLAAIAAAVPE